MPHQFIREQNVNIYEHPNLDSQRETLQKEQLSIGDLHANAIKLLFFLIKEHVIELNDKNDYAQLVAIFKKIPTGDHEELKKLFKDNSSDKYIQGSLQKKSFNDIWQGYQNQKISVLDEKDLQLFQDILTRITVKNFPNLIRLLGDETGDRSACDLYVLYLLSMMHAKQLPYEILLSNHGMEFVLAYENLMNGKKSKLEKQVIADFQAGSLIALQLLLDRNIISKETLFSLINTAYKPYLKILSYSLSEDYSHINIFSHAGIDLEIIKALAEKFEIPYNDTTALDLARTIDQINEVIQNHANKNEINKLCDIKIMEQLADEKPIDSHKYPMEFILWNRSYGKLNRPEIMHPNTDHKYSISFTHAHDSGEITQQNRIVLDNSLGKRGIAEDLYGSILSELSQSEREYFILAEKNLAPTQSKLNEKQTASSAETEKTMQTEVNASDQQQKATDDQTATYNIISTPKTNSAKKMTFKFKRKANETEEEIEKGEEEKEPPFKKIKLENDDFPSFSASAQDPASENMEGEFIQAPTPELDVLDALCADSKRSLPKFNNNLLGSRFSASNGIFSRVNNPEIVNPAPYNTTDSDTVMKDINSDIQKFTTNPAR